MSRLHYWTGALSLLAAIGCCVARCGGIAVPAWAFWVCVGVWGVACLLDGNGTL